MYFESNWSHKKGEKKKKRLGDWTKATKHAVQGNVGFLHGMSHVFSPTLIDFFFRKTFSPLVETTLNSILPENVAVRDLGGQWGDLMITEYKNMMAK